MHCQLMPCDEPESTRHSLPPHGSVLVVGIAPRTASLPASLPARQSGIWGLQGHKQVGGALFSLDIETGRRSCSWTTGTGCASTAPTTWRSAAASSTGPLSSSQTPPAGSSRISGQMRSWESMSGGGTSGVAASRWRLTALCRCISASASPMHLLSELPFTDMSPCGPDLHGSWCRVEHCKMCTLAPEGLQTKSRGHMGILLCAAKWSGVVPRRPDSLHHRHWPLQAGDAHLAPHHLCL